MTVSEAARPGFPRFTRGSMIIKPFLNAGLFIAILLYSPFQACSFTVEIRGGEAASFLPPLPKDKAVSDKTRYDAIVVGGGPAGMTAASFLSEHGEKVLLIEKNRYSADWRPGAAWNTAIDVLSVETNRWPFSVHVAKPAHFSKHAKILRRPLGRIFFANNNIGTPSFEEALFRGHCAANNVLNRIDKDFTQESWSNCPLEP